MPEFAVRPFAPDDYPDLARVRGAVFPEHPWSPEELRWEDEQAAADPRIRKGRLLALLGGEVVGFGEFSHNPGAYHPRRFTLDGGLLPEARGLGLGRALYEEVLAALPVSPLALRANAREDGTRARRFLADRGFAETMRYWEATLEPKGFDFAPYEGLEERLRGEGIEIKPIAELSGEPGWREELHDLFSQARLDVPRAEPATPVSLERFAAFYLDAPGDPLDSLFVALDGQRYVGMSTLYGSEGTADMFTGFTGVRRAYRGRGIALALKLRAIRYALTRGAPRIRTDNSTENRPMLAINEKLGFAKEPVWLSLLKTFEEEG